METYYIILNGTTLGPMTKEQVFAYPVTPDTQVSVDGGNWQPLYSRPELMEIFHRNQMSATTVYIDQDAHSKKILCGIMAILFGGLGVQYFVLGRVGAGFLTILLTLVTCGVWEVVTLVQGILMLCMTDSDFRRKYMDTTASFPLF